MASVLANTLTSVPWPSSSSRVTFSKAATATGHGHGVGEHGLLGVFVYCDYRHEDRRQDWISGVRIDFGIVSGECCR
jgi:hypothetical protein